MNQLRQKDMEGGRLINYITEKNIHKIYIFGRLFVAYSTTNASGTRVRKRKTYHGIGNCNNNINTQNSNENIK